MKARAAKKLLMQLLSKQVEIMRVPAGGALAVRGLDRMPHASAQAALRDLALLTGLPVVALPWGVELRALAASEILASDTAKAQDIGRQDEAAGLTPSHYSLVAAFGCSREELQGGMRSHLWDAYRVAFKAQRDARFEPAGGAAQLLPQKE